MKNSVWDFSVLQECICAIQMCVVVHLLRMQKAAVYMKNTETISLEDNANLVSHCGLLNYRSNLLEAYWADHLTLEGVGWG